MKKCCACGQTKEFKLFYKNKAVADGHFQRCKKCMNNNILCKQGRPTGMKYDVKERITSKNSSNSWEEIRLANPSKKDYIETYEFLKKIGYKLDESIHEQFCMKHDLQPTEAQKFKNHFSPEDCGMA